MYQKPVKIKLFGRNRRTWIYSDRIVIISLARETKPLKDRIDACASQVQQCTFEIIDGAKPYYEKIILQAGLTNVDEIKNFFEPEQLNKVNYEPESGKITRHQQSAQKLCA